MMFDVNGTMTVTLMIPLTCSGRVAITGVFNLCPVIDGLSAIPSEVTVGASISLTAEVHDGDNGPLPLGATWQVRGGGMLSNTSMSGATFTCTATRDVRRPAQVSDGDTTPRCADTGSVTVVCTQGGV